MNNKLVLLVIFISIMGISCELEPEIQTSPVSSDEFLLLEIQHHFSHESPGTCRPGFEIYGSICYSFNNKTKELTLHCSPFNRNTIENANTILASHTEYNENLGSGNVAYYEMITSFPYIYNLYEPPFYRNLDSLVIRPINNTYFGIKFKNTQIVVRENSTALILRRYPYLSGSVECNIIDSTMIYNHGKFKKNKIRFKY
jgi:hypothetical protein